MSVRFRAPVSRHFAVGSLPSGSPSFQAIHSAMCIPLSSTSTKRLKHRSSGLETIAKGPSLPHHALLGLPETFFEWPTARKSSDITAHGGLRYLHTSLLEERLAMLLEGEVGIFLQVLWQPLLQGFALNRGPAGDLVGVYISGVASSKQPAFYRGQGDFEELEDFLPWDAPVHRREHPQSQILRIIVHKDILT